MNYYRLPRWESSFPSQGLQADLTGTFAVVPGSNQESALQSAGATQVEKGGGGSAPSFGGIFPAASASFGAIMDAYNAALSAGCGTVLIPAGDIVLPEPLPMASGIVYQGARWTLQYSGTSTIPDGSGTTPLNGTILMGNGTFDCFHYNYTDAVSSPYANIGQGSAAQLTNCGIRDLVIDNFAYGVKIGAQFLAGANYSEFENLWITNCAQWGLWLENILHCNFRNIRSMFNTVGQFMHNNSSTNIAVSNNNYYDILATVLPNSLTSRGFCVSARQASQNSLNRFWNVQANRFNNGTTITTSATAASSSSSILVGSTTGLAVGMPVAFTTGGNGFTAQPRVYFVASIIDGTHLTVSNQMFYGTAVAATGSGTLGNLVCMGFPAMEFAATDSSSAIAGNAIYHADVEAGGTCRLLIQNCPSFEFHGLGLNHGSDAVVEVCARYSQEGNFYFYNTGAWLDFANGDFNNLETKIWGTLGNIACDNGSTPLGVYSSTGFNTETVGSETHYLSLSQVTFNNNPTLQSVPQGGQPEYLQPNVPVGQTAQTFPFTPFNMNTALGGCVVYTGTGAGTWTLPTPSPTINGLPFEVVNDGGGDLTLGAPNFNGSSRASITIHAGASISVRAVYNLGGYAVTGIGGTYSAGVVSTV